MKIEQYDKIRLNDGRTASVVKIFEESKAYLVDVDLPGPDWDTIDITYTDIKSVISMKQKELKTHFGNIHMYKNNAQIPFYIEWYDAGENSLDGLCKLYPDMNHLNQNDIIRCEFDDGILQCDGGGERMLNIVGIYDGYTIGMGTVDSQEINYSDSERSLPYENYGYTDKGFEVHIVDDPQKYFQKPNFIPLYFIVAWKMEVTDDIWTTVSCATSDMMI